MVALERAKGINIPNLLKNRLLHHILSWDASWFTNNEDKELQCARKSLRFSSPVLSYDDFNQYCRTKMPLLIDQVWYDLMLLYQKNDVDTQNSIPNIKLSIIRSASEYLIVNPNHRGKDQLLRIKVVTRIQSDSKGKIWIPRRNTLVKFKNPLIGIDQFGFVDTFSRQEVQGKSEYEISYDLIIKCQDLLPNSIRVEQVNLKLTVILNCLYSLSHLPEFPLYEGILRPIASYYEFSPVVDEDIFPVTGDKLNPKQMEAMSRIVKTVEDKKPKICLLSGPAGTGKSKVIVNSVLSMLSRKSTYQILICCQSNQSVDSMVLQFLEKKPEMEQKGIRCNVLRLGSEEKMNSFLKSVSLSTLTKEMDVEKKSEYVTEFILTSDIIVSTLMASQSHIVRNQLKALKISVCIIDDASQASELETFLPFNIGVKILFLFGDIQQIKPKLYSEEAKAISNLDKSFLHRVQKVFENSASNPCLVLDTQYRMPKAIACWPNNFFYQGVLKNEATVRPLGIHKYKLFNHALPEIGLLNIGEAKLVVNIVYSLYTFMDLNKIKFQISLGVIAFSEEQRDLIINMLDQEEKFKFIDKVRRDKIDVKVVKMTNSFQGSECDIVILSCVQSINTEEIDDPGMLCVALTRAKHTLIVCGNLKKYKKNPMWEDLVNDALERDALINIQLDDFDKPKYLKQLLIFAE